MNTLLQFTSGFETFQTPGSLILNQVGLHKQDGLQRRQADSDVIARLAHALKAKDQLLLRHCHRVQHFTYLLTRRLDLPGNITSNIHLAALLHDIGKLSISNRLLNKAGSLTRQKFERIKQHPTAGALMLQQLGIFEAVVPLVVCHHEFWDGRGYPHGLQRNTIPLGARIIAIADAFEVMTSEQRVYQWQRTPLEAMEELLRCAGTQFDPTLVDLFCASLQNDLQPIAC